MLCIKYDPTLTPYIFKVDFLVFYNLNFNDIGKEKNNVTV